MALKFVLPQSGRRLPRALLAAALGLLSLVAPGFTVPAHTAPAPAHTAPPAAERPPFLIYTNYTGDWLSVVSGAIWPRDSVIHWYTVAPSQHATSAHSFGGTNSYFDRVLAARSAGVLSLRQNAWINPFVDDTSPQLRLTTVTGAVIRNYGPAAAVLDADASALTNRLLTLEKHQDTYGLYRRRLDGSDRRLMVSFAAGLVANSMVLSSSGKTAYLLLNRTESSRRKYFRIVAVEVETGARRIVRNLHGSQFRNIDISPDGRWAVVTATRSGGSFPILIPTQGGDSRILPIVSAAARFSPDGKQVYVTQPGTTPYVDQTGAVHWRNGTVARIVLATYQTRPVAGVSTDPAGEDLAILRP